MCELRFFGSFEGWVNDQLLPPPRTRKIAQLLLFLALREGRPVERTLVAGTLWPESEDAAGAQNLRRVLADTRAWLGEDAWRLGAPFRHELQLDMRGGLCDICEFDRLEGDAALALYRGALLEGIHEDWVLRERHVREERFLGILLGLAQRALERGEGRQALALVRRAEAIEPLRESTQNLLYQALALTDGLSAAERAFREFRALLWQELRQEPSAALKPPQASVTTVTARSLKPLPTFLSPLVGRERDIAQVQQRLAEPGARLVTLTGIGGIGKTRLAVAVAQTREAAFVELETLPPNSSQASLCQATLMALGMDSDRESHPQEVLLRTLQGRRLLLVLDNLEHLVGESPLVSLVGQLLQRLPELTLLTTSRTPLGLPGERLVPVAPLGLEDEAVALFACCAYEANPDFALTPKSRPRVLDLCRQLDGLPLAITLAAARLRVLTLEQLLAGLGQPLRMLVGGGHLARQRTMEGALRWSWDLLSVSDRQLLAQLSVFLGGWMDEAALVIMGGDTLALAALADHSLVVPGERWRLLETVRVFARERLDELDQRGEVSLEAVRERHATYYLQKAQALYDGQLRYWPEAAPPPPWEPFFASDEANLRAAQVYWHTHRGEFSDEALLLALLEFWRHRNSGHRQEASVWIERLCTEPLPEPSLLRAQLYATAGTWASWLGHSPATVCQLWEGALALSDACQAPHLGARLRFLLGQEYVQNEELERGKMLLERVLAQEDLPQSHGERLWSRLYLCYLSKDVAALDSELAQARKLPNPEVFCYAARYRVRLAIAQSELTLGKALAQEALAFLPPSDLTGYADLVRRLNELARLEGDGVTAEDYARQLLTRMQSTNQQAESTWARVALAKAYQLQQRYEDAKSTLCEAFTDFGQLRDHYGQAQCIELLATLATEQKRPEEAISLLSFLLRCFEEKTLGVNQPTIRQTTQKLSSLREALDTEQFQSAYEQGKQWSKELVLLKLSNL